MHSGMSVKSRPRILVTPWRRELPTYLGERTVLDTLDPAYTDRIAEAGGLPLVVPRPPDEPGATAEELLSLAHGLVLSGGGDVAPSTYGAQDEGALGDADIRADRHAVTIASGSRAAAVYGAGELRVNTIHHNAVAEPGRLAVTATAGGGLVEAVEPQADLTDWPALGVQWHPEKMSEPEQRRPFEFLVIEADRYASR